MSFPRTGQVTDEYDRLVPGASIYVYKEDGTAAVVTSDGTTPLEQPIPTDEFGAYSYYVAAAGVYREDTWFGAKLRFKEVVPIGLDGLYPPSPRGGLIFGFDADENPVAVNAGGADSALRTDLAASGGAALVGVAGYAPGIIRSVQQIFDEGLSLRKDFGAIGVGVETAKFQSALDAVIETGGAQLRIPGLGGASNYTVDEKLLFDISAVADRFAKRISIIGPGSAHTRIKMTGVADTLLELVGNPAVSETRLDLHGFGLFGDNTIGSRGLHVNVGSYGGLYDVTIEGFDQGLEFDNVEQASLINCQLRWGRKAFKTNTGTSSAANSILLLNTNISNNSVCGLDLTDANLFQMVGGSVMYNGAIGGGPTNFGCKLNNPGTSYGSIGFKTVAFEANGGEADLWIDSTSVGAAIAVETCDFARSTASGYATNCVRMDGSEATAVRLSTSKFRSFNDYSPDASRPYLALNNTAAVLHDDGTNEYQAALEKPSWAPTIYPVIVTGGAVHTATYS